MCLYDIIHMVVTMKENNYIVGIGAANIDISGRSTSGIKTFDSNPGKISMSVGGVTRNVLDNYCRLGGNAYLLACLGDDLFGKYIASYSEAAGIDMSCVNRIHQGSSCYVNVLNNDGEMEVAISDMAIIENLNVDYFKRHDKIIGGSEIVMCDPSLPSASLDYLFQTYDKPIFVDTVSRAYASTIANKLEMFHTVKANKLEAEILAGKEINDSQDVELAASIILGKGAKRVFITLGKDGCYYASKKEKLFYKLDYQPNIKNVTGAGDAFMAMLIHCYMANADTLTTLKMASASSCIALESENTVSEDMSLENVRRILQEK